MKKIVKEIVKEKTLFSFDFYSFEGNIDASIEYLKELKSRVMETYPEAIEILLEYYSGYGDDKGSIEIYIKREERDAELAARLATEKRLADKQKNEKAVKKQQEIALYEKLKKKYG